MKHVISFLNGLHLKCKKPDFIQSLEEAKMYLSRKNVLKSMLQLRNGVGTDLEGDGKKDEGSGNSKKTCLSTELIETKFKGIKSGPFIVGDLEVLKLGKMVNDLNCVNDDGSIWPLGYTATRKSPSLAEILVYVLYIRWKFGGILANKPGHYLELLQIMEISMTGQILQRARI